MKMDKVKMTKYRLSPYFLVIAVITGMLIIALVLYQNPQPGVADQGDFDRVMNVAGLELKPEHINDSGFDRFLHYPVTQYKISDLSASSLFKRLSATSVAYLITLINTICLLFGQDTFKTIYLATVYAILYIYAFWLVFTHLNIRDHLKLGIFILIIYFVFFDGNYLVWFNSLYGEPMMITALALYIAAWVRYIYHRHVTKSQDNIFLSIVFIIVAACLFLGSKLQVISALPVILLMIFSLWRENRGLFKPRQIWIFGILSFIIILYPLSYAYTNKSISDYTRYNSVFYGILKDSPNPTQDLIDLGLNPDLAVDAGKHAFLGEDEYVKYVPLSEPTRQEFYNKISNCDLVWFYITHPQRFVTGMEYTARHAFITSTALGKYQKTDFEQPVSEFNRFTHWSSLREEYMPKNLWFLVLVYSVVIGLSALAYKKWRQSAEIVSLLKLFWAVTIIGLLQFPMPLIGNGQADTAKQLFLFNFTFDLIVVVLCCWVISRCIDFCRCPKLLFHTIGKKEDGNPAPLTAPKES